MSDLFPRMLYKNHGTEEMHGGLFDTFIVNDEQQLADCLADGWHLTTDAAREPQLIESKQDQAMPTRDELKRKATELGIEYPPNIPNDRLSALIAAKV